MEERQYCAFVPQVRDCARKAAAVIQTGKIPEECRNCRCLLIQAALEQHQEAAAREARRAFWRRSVAMALEIALVTILLTGVVLGGLRAVDWTIARRSRISLERLHAEYALEESGKMSAVYVEKDGSRWELAVVASSDYGPVFAARPLNK